MPEYQKQHWLPKSYLKLFRIPIPYKKDYIYRFDGIIYHQVPVASQCFKKYFYSSSERESAEKEFWNIENDFIKLVKKVLNFKPLFWRDRKDLIYMMFIMHLRTAAFENKTDKENIVAFRIRFNNFLALEISNLDENNLDPKLLMT